MRAKPNKDRAEARVVKRFHKLHTPLVELIQALQDLVPDGMELSDRVELTKMDGHIQIAYAPRPMHLVIRDSERRITVKIEEADNNYDEPRGANNG